MSSWISSNTDPAKPKPLAEMKQRITARAIGVWRLHVQVTRGLRKAGRWLRIAAHVAVVLSIAMVGGRCFLDAVVAPRYVPVSTDEAIRCMILCGIGSPVVSYYIFAMTLYAFARFERKDPDLPWLDYWTEHQKWFRNISACAFLVGYTAVALLASLVAQRLGNTGFIPGVLAYIMAILFHAFVSPAPREATPETEMYFEDEPWIDRTRARGANGGAYDDAAIHLAMLSSKPTSGTTNEESQ